MTIGSNAFRARRPSSSCGAVGPSRTANMVMSSTIVTSSIPCAANRWRCSIWSIAINSSPAEPSPWRSTPCSPVSAREPHVARWSAFWRSPTSALARRSSPSRCRLLSTTASFPISLRWSNASGQRTPHCLSSSSGCPPSPSTIDRDKRWRSGMKATDKIDAARIDLLLSELRLPGIKLIWTALAATADKEGWPAARFLAALAEQEMVERNRRRFERHLEEARLPPGKTLDTFDFTAVPMISKAQVQALAAGDAWLERGANLLCFGPPGAGKSHLAAALGLALIEKGWRVLFTRTTDLVQKLQIARRDLALEAAIAKLDKYHLLILDDLAYVTKDQAETSVLFELISARYERRSMLITANQPFGEWGKIFPDQAMTLAAIDRLVHHATILEMNVDSYRRKEAVDNARGPGRPPTRATIKGSS